MCLLLGARRRTTRHRQRPFLWWGREMVSSSGPCLTFNMHHDTAVRLFITHLELRTCSACVRKVNLMIVSEAPGPRRPLCGTSPSSWSRSNAKDYRQDLRSHTMLVRSSAQLSCRDHGWTGRSRFLLALYAMKICPHWFLFHTKTCVSGGGHVCSRTSWHHLSLDVWTITLK